MNRKKINSPDNAETEKCILCGKDTYISVATPVTIRKYYLSGCGQLCEDCYHRLELAGIAVKKTSNEDT